MTLETTTDAERAASLRSMKGRATGLFVVVTVVFIVARIAEDGGGWIPYVRAAAEAAMVGAIADWFAVTALFRHPLRIPIPHTAIIPNRKDQLGANLGEFVEQNFLSPDVVTEKLRSMSVATRMGQWLNDETHANLVSSQIGAAARGALDVIRDDDVQQVVTTAVVDRINAIPLSSTAGKVLELATADGRHHEVLDSMLVGFDRFLQANRETFRARFANESPWWVPETLDDRIFGKIFDALHNFMTDVIATPDHEVRRYLDSRLAELAVALRESPEMAARGEAIKADLLAHPAVRSWLDSLWIDLKTVIVRQTEDPDSELRSRLSESIRTLGARVASEPGLAAKLDRWIEGATRHVVDSSRHEIADLITTTVEKWDPDEASSRIELAVGKDLQYIRINGTIVGGLAGIVIYSVGQLLG